MITFPNAKINLGLNIVGKRPDGYHNIETIFYPIQLCDILEIVPSASGETTLHQLGKGLDCPPEKNLVMKAYRLLCDRAKLPCVDIYLYKNIPDGAGMGGGSADASFTLKMLNEMFSIGLDTDTLANMASKLGADCPFFIHNTTMYATGIGDILSPVTVDLKGKYLLGVKPPVAVPTAEAYRNATPAEPDIDIREIIMRPVNEWSGLLKNDFEQSIFPTYPLLADIKLKIQEAGALYASMSGSGSTIYGIFDNAILAENAKNMFKKYRNFVIPL